MRYIVAVVKPIIAIMCFLLLISSLTGLTSYERAREERVMSNKKRLAELVPDEARIPGAPVYIQCVLSGVRLHTDCSAGVAKQLVHFAAFAVLVCQRKLRKCRSGTDLRRPDVRQLAPRACVLAAACGAPSLNAQLSSQFDYIIHDSDEWPS